MRSSQPFSFPLSQLTPADQSAACYARRPHSIWLTGKVWFLFQPAEIENALRRLFQLCFLPPSFGLSDHLAGKRGCCRGDESTIAHLLTQGSERGNVMRSPDTMLVKRMWVWNESFWPNRRTAQSETRNLSIYESYKQFRFFFYPPAMASRCRSVKLQTCHSTRVGTG